MAEIINSMDNGANIGQIHIADEVMAIIAGTAALEIEGVAGAAGNILKGEIVEKIGRKNFSKGVKITLDENKISVDLNLVIKSGYKIQTVSQDVQQRVKNALETMTGLIVEHINVNIINMVVSKEKKQT